MTTAIIIIGAGGHARVLADALLLSGQSVLGFTDKDASLHGTSFLGLPVLGSDELVLASRSPRDTLLVNGIGGAAGTALRRRIQRELESRDWRFTSVRHPSAIVSPHAVIGHATQILANGVVQPGARLGPGTIVNTGAIVEHDCDVGDQVHVAPRALLCGDVRIGQYSHIGAGAVVRQGVTLGPETIVAAGAVVVANSEGRCTLKGVPARADGGRE